MQMTAQNSFSSRNNDNNVDQVFWDRLAPKYAQSKISDRAGYETTLKNVSDLLHPDHAVLELGCGTGSTAITLAPGSKSYLATDISSGMIDQCEIRNKDSNRSNLKFEVATANDMANSGQKFDLVLGFNYLHLVDDLPVALGDIFTLLKPCGRFISKTPCLGDMNPLIKMAIPVMRLFGKAPENVVVFSHRQLRQAMEATGFVIEGPQWHGSGRKDTRPFFIATRP